jgi:hypothetical protein
VLIQVDIADQDSVRVRDSEIRDEETQTRQSTDWGLDEQSEELYFVKKNVLSNSIRYSLWNV